jgi:hypothetical protein
VNKVILNWQRPLWEGDQEVEKRSDRDEPKWVPKHMCMEAMLGIYLYSYLSQMLYSKRFIAKMLCLFYYLLYFLFNKIREQEGRTGSTWKEGGEVAQTMYTHVSKCKNNKKKKDWVFLYF